MSDIYLLACAVLVYSGFCRLVHMTTATRLVIRAAIWVLTVVAAVGVAAVLVWGYHPHWVAVAQVVAIAIVQVACSSLWRAGVPDDYQRPSQLEIQHDRP
jgi:membrane protein YdbS with pleckstrin-like domain